MTSPWPRSLFPRILAGLLALLAVPRPLPAQSASIFAAASLTEAFRALGAAFETRHPHDRVNFNFAGSQQLVLQLTQGAQGDLLATADERWMREARDSGLLASEPVVFVRNPLIVILPRANRAGLSTLEDLARPGVKVVLAADAVPIGHYSREVLDKLAGRPGFGRDYAKKVLANVVSLEDNVKGVVSKVELGEADAAIVYRSDANGGAGPALRRIEIPDSENVVGDFPIALLKGGDNPDLARTFLAFVLSPAGQGIFERLGFESVNAVPGSGAASKP